jgi:hypothetical protein
LKKRLIYLFFPLITLILEILPFGAVLNFGNPEGAPWRRTYSYFDLTPFGYANFSPLLTAISTCIIFIFLVIYLFRGKKSLIKTAKVFLWAGALLSLCPLLQGINNFSVVGALISVSLVSELILIIVISKGKKGD